MATRLRLPATSLSRRLSQISHNLETEVMHAEWDNAEDILETFKEMSSGSITRQMLRLMGHPYGRGSHTPSGQIREPVGQDHAILNVQDDKLRQGWRVDGPRYSGSGKSVITTIHNVVSYSRFMNRTGTILMQPRPIVQRVREMTRDRVQARRLNALRKVVRNG